MKLSSVLSFVLPVSADIPATGRGPPEAEGGTQPGADGGQGEREAPAMPTIDCADIVCTILSVWVLSFDPAHGRRLC